MKIEKKENYSLIISEEKSFSVFFEQFKNNYSKLKNEHIIVQLYKNKNVSKKELTPFLSIFEKHQKNGTFFVVISDNVNIDDFPETFNIVPTLIEAEDILEMEKIQQNLKF